MKRLELSAVPRHSMSDPLTMNYMIDLVTWDRVDLVDGTGRTLSTRRSRIPDPRAQDVFGASGGRDSLPSLRKQKGAP